MRKRRTVLNIMRSIIDAIELAQKHGASTVSSDLHQAYWLVNDTIPSNVYRSSSDSRPVNERVQRWDVYDAADHIADIPGLIAAGKLDEAATVAQEWQHKLFRAAEIKGPVGPYPEYRQLHGYSWICADCRDYNNGEDRICVFCGNPQPSVTGITTRYALPADQPDPR